MPKAICLIDACEQVVSSRGLCAGCYQRGRNAGTLDDIALPSNYGRRIVTNVDEEAMTCDCPRCGPGARLRIRANARGRYACRKCSRGISRGGRGSPESRRAATLRAKYDLTLTEYEIRIQAQGGKCLICRGTMDAPQVDHDHDSGHVRGILCRACNVGLGFFRDDPALLRRATKYLDRYRVRLG